MGETRGAGAVSGAEETTLDELFERLVAGLACISCRTGFAGGIPAGESTRGLAGMSAFCAPPSTTASRAFASAWRASKLENTSRANSAAAGWARIRKTSCAFVDMDGGTSAELGLGAGITGNVASGTEVGVATKAALEEGGGNDSEVGLETEDGVDAETGAGVGAVGAGRAGGGEDSARAD
jgi:hypothetical protein